MAMSDPLGDMLTRIRNGQRTGKSKVRAPASKLRSNVLEVLQREGYIRGIPGSRNCRESSTASALPACRLLAA
jgi:small subunit ribosomal protein S8